MLRGTVGTMSSKRWIASSLLAVALGANTGCSEEQPGIEEDHGYILMRLVPAADTRDDWASGSTTFTVSVQYDSCLQEFYEAHPRWRENDVDGMPIFDAWEGMLCELPVDDLVGCQVESIFQEFSNTSQLLIRFTPTDLDGMNGTVVPIGPFPTEAMAGCEPVVRIESGAAVGVEFIGEKIWEAVGFSSETAVVGQDEIVEGEVIVFN